MRDIFDYDITYVNPSAPTDCRRGGGEAGQPLGTGVFGQFSLAGNRVAALHLATRVFLAGNHIGDKQRDKEQERAGEKRRRNWRNLHVHYIAFWGKKRELRF